MLQTTLLQFAAKLTPEEVGIPKNSAESLFTNVLDLVYFFFGVAAVISIIISGILYVVSNGDSGKVTQAKNGVLYGVVGLVISLMAFVITGFVIGRF
jgi:hypothetical protein